MTPDDVLKFWFGDELETGSAGMDTSEYIGKAGPRWFVKSEEFDNEVKNRGFPDLIRKVSAKEVGPEWEGAKGRQARILLFDQLSRNAFRGSAEAFQYDEAAVELSRTTLTEDMSSFPAAVVQFYLMPLMHSESMDDQNALVAKLEEAKASRTGYSVEFFEKNLLPFAIAHRDVIAKFGRFPHRNENIGWTVRLRGLVVRGSLQKEREGGMVGWQSGRREEGRGDEKAGLGLRSEGGRRMRQRGWRVTSAQAGRSHRGERRAEDDELTGRNESDRDNPRAIAGERLKCDERE